jgi:Uma2 family endonuclease
MVMTSVTGTKTPLTSDDLSRLPDDGWLYELRMGELIRRAPTGEQHGQFTNTLNVLLSIHVRANGLGIILAAETGFKLAMDPDTVRAPDIAFVRRERVPEDGPPGGYRPGRPDLAVEAVSPSDSAEGVDEKVNEYLRAGTRPVWLLFSRRRCVEFCHPDGTRRVLTEAQTRDGADVVPGFACRVGEISAAW